MRYIIIAFCLFVITGFYARQAQRTHNYTHIKPADWVINRSDTLDCSLGQYQGQNALVMTRKIFNYKLGCGLAYPKSLDFKDGVIEADLAWPGKQGGFVGIAFRIKDTHHYQTVYFRPESSGTINAIQYMPEKKGEFNWWDYEAAKYQAKATLPMHDWFHVKLVVKGNSVSVFVNNEPKPAMVYNNMDNSLQSGTVGYWFGNSQQGAFKNLTVKTN